MTQKEIDYILKTESGIILLEKKSEHSFLEYIFSNWISIFSAFYFLTRKKLDKLILTEKRLIYIIKNKVYVERNLSGIKSLNYNGNKTTLELTDQNHKYSFPLDKLRVSYEESKLIKQKLTEFMNRKNKSE